MSYLDNLETVMHDTQQFLKSEYGVYITSTLEEMKSSAISEASNKDEPHKEWQLAKYNAFQEVINLIQTPLEDHKPTRG